MEDPKTNQTDLYWERAGQLGHADALFSSRALERHINVRIATIALSIARELGLDFSATVLELGCGDATFALDFLAPNFKTVWASDKSRAAIERAKTRSRTNNVTFEALDAVTLDYNKLPSFDGVFLMGFLHHVKSFTPDLIANLARAVPRAVVLEPNGNHVVRKLLEFTPSYKAAGEESFRTAEIVRIFQRAGYRNTACRRMNLFPNFTPEPLFKLLRSIEPFIERTPLLNALCTVNIFGFAKT